MRMDFPRGELNNKVLLRSFFPILWPRTVNLPTTKKGCEKAILLRKTYTANLIRIIRIFPFFDEKAVLVYVVLIELLDVTFWNSGNEDIQEERRTLSNILET